MEDNLNDITPIEKFMVLLMVITASTIPIIGLEQLFFNYLPTTKLVIIDGMLFFICVIYFNIKLQKEIKNRKKR